MSRFVTALVAAVFLSLIAPALAGTTGIVRGVISLSGRPAPHAALTLTGEGQKLTTTSNAHGDYQFANVPFGHYHLVARVPGTATRTVDVYVTGDAVATVDVDLLKQIASTAVTANAGVGGAPVAVNTVTKAQIQSSPERNSLNRLIETEPGIVRFSYNEPVANGFHGLTYYVDGAPLPLATSSNFAEVMDPRDIDSLEIMTGAFPAEYGGNRQGAVVNIVTSRLSDVQPGNYGLLSLAGGSYATSISALHDVARFGSSEITLDLNTQRNARGIDTPTYQPNHDNSSQGDEFLRFITQINKQSTLAFDMSNSLSQFQIPINTDPNNPYDPNFSVPGTDDVQREYDRFFNLNFTTTSKDGNSVFQFVPYVRYTRTAYEGDLAKDVLALEPNPSYGTTATAPLYANQIGLDQDRRATYVGANVSELRESAHHSIRVGVDASRETFAATQTFACYTSDCNIAPGTPPPAPPAPGYYAFNSGQAHSGTQIGIYAQDKWQPSRLVAIDYGVRYDHSTGYAGGFMIEPRIGINVWDGGRNVAHIYYGRMYAAPQLEDVREDCVLLSGCPSTPVYNLQPERDAYAEMGVSHTFSPHMSGYFNIFERSVTNVLDTTQFLNTPLFAVFNNAIGRDTGVEFHLQENRDNGDYWFWNATISGSYAGGISGSTFLFPTNVNGNLPLTSGAQLAPEDHDQTVASNGGYTHRFGATRTWYASLQADYGTGYPVSFQNINGAVYSGRLPAHLTFDGTVGREARPGQLGFDLDIQNLLNHQYVIKIANGFNTTQIAPGRSVLFRVTAPF
jgi:outer membrane receptor protein involved in Fe transport